MLQSRDVREETPDFDALLPREAEYRVVSPGRDKSGETPHSALLQPSFAVGMTCADV